jgi:p-hydroxybenzoate 3-monooxygenase
MRTQVGIIGAGPAGLFLARLLHRAGIDHVILEARSRDYVEARVRAGVLEQITVELMRDLGVDQRLQREGMVDHFIDMRFVNGRIHIDLPKLAGGKHVMIYGQQEIVKDLVAAQLADGGPLLFEAEALRLDGLDGTRPTIRYRHDGRDETLECDLIAGCDGFHGVSRAAIPDHILTTYDHVFPFAWLGILSDSPPIADMTYCNHDRGFALFSRRSPQVSRLYLQCAVDENLDEWPDARIWDELHIRLGDTDHSELREGRISQKGVAALRSFVAAPMQLGRLYLAGDAAHIVPPTGAKGLNLAVADVQVLARGMIAFLRGGDRARLDRYSDTCLRRVWKTVRYSTSMTNLLHRFTTHTPFERQIQLSELDYILGSRAAQTSIAESYIGLPLELD